MSSGIDSIVGIRPKEIEPVVAHALKGYEAAVAGHIIGLNIEEASKLELTPEAGFSARSVSEVTHRPSGEILGSLSVYAIQFHEGTGDTALFRPSELDTGRFQRRSGTMPTAVKDSSTQLALPIGTYFPLEVPHRTPAAFVNSAALLGKSGSQVVEVGRIGCPPGELEALAKGSDDGSPAVFRIAGGNEPGELAFGEARAIYNDRPATVQIIGVVSLADEQAGKHPKFWEYAEPQPPQA